jgi:hypothetical protein
MRLFKAISTSVFFALAACGQAAAPTEAGAQTAAAAVTADVTAAEKTAILAALQLSANAQGQVENECGDLVTPEFRPLDLGAGVGRAVAFVIGGGPSAAACYGDGPLIVVYRNTGGAWRDIYRLRGGMMIILSTQHNGANDVANGGPGFSFPVMEWNGSTYASANREVGDAALGDARFVP